MSYPESRFLNPSLPLGVGLDSRSITMENLARGTKSLIERHCQSTDLKHFAVHRTNDYNTLRSRFANPSFILRFQILQAIVIFL